jgi:hypothetical protein
MSDFGCVASTAMEHVIEGDARRLLPLYAAYR